MFEAALCNTVSWITNLETANERLHQENDKLKRKDWLEMHSRTHNFKAFGPNYRHGNGNLASYTSSLFKESVERRTPVGVGGGERLSSWKFGNRAMMSEGAEIHEGRGYFKGFLRKEEGDGMRL